ncbi:manganese efflux pump MntP family protein [Parasphingorhabdus sp.]|uniref:manganese efflux pump MntP n=1 Tax=Parasphingorhabdus sp. TaxID=2709688 RepID=UPI003592F1AE
METFIIIMAVAIGLAMDAFAVAVAQGAAGHDSRSYAIRIGLVFGLAQGIMPLLGWMLGAAFLAQISAFDHWIALILLVGLGLKMLWEARGLTGNERPAMLSGWSLAVAAIATSIDALAAGLTFPAFGLPVLQTCIAIALITALLSAWGVLVGGSANKRIGKVAEIAGGLVLIALGLKIFIEHQFFGG